MIKIGTFFDVVGDILKVESEPNGLINKTFILTTTKRRYILQKINQYVFKKPQVLMDNIEKVTTHLAMKNEFPHEVLTIVKTLDGHNYYYDGQNYYRLYNYLEDCFVYHEKPPIKMSYEMGKCIGAFQKNLEDFDIRKLKNHMVDFHNTIKRYQDLLISYENATSSKRNEAKSIIKKIINNRHLLGSIERSLAEKRIPYRIIHNDTKFNNIMFDMNTNRALCLIDLDTVSKGSSLYDYADALRMVSSTCLEDDGNFQKIKFDQMAFILFTIGYLQKMKHSLTYEEITLMGQSIYIITMECGIRFLTDYLNDNIYFKIEYPNHNLVRAKNQFKFAQEVKKNLKFIEKTIEQIYYRLN